MQHEVWLAIAVFVAAVLYSSVGHAGASGYLAAMALFGVAAQEMKPTALVLNILVATIGTVRYCAAGSFSARVFWPLALGAVPLAYWGGAIQLPGTLYRQLIGLILIYAAIRMCMKQQNETQTLVNMHPGTGMACGAGVGFLAGITGTGGGIFLTPILILQRWAGIRQAAGISAAFILVNSIAGLAGNIHSVRGLPPGLWKLAAAAVLGGLIGAELGSRRLTPPAMRYVLSVVLLIAALKLLLIR